MVAISLTKISTNNRLSEETACFSATLVVDGKPVGDIANRGHGGCHEVRLKPDCGWTEQTLNEACKATYGKCKSFFGTDYDLDYDLELVVSTLVENHIALKEVRRGCKRKIMVATPIRGNMREFSYKGIKAITPEMVQHFKSKHPDMAALVLNDMPDQQVLKAIGAEVI